MTESNHVLDRPRPDGSPLMAPFWRAADQHSLQTPLCLDCHKRHFPPAAYCPHCLSANLEWRTVKGSGKLISWIIYHKAYWTSVEPELPYLVATVDLDEGVRLITNILDWQNQHLAYGARVEADFVPLTTGETLPVFRMKT